MPLKQSELFCLIAQTFNLGSLGGQGLVAVESQQKSVQGYCHYLVTDTRAGQLFAAYVAERGEGQSYLQRQVPG